MSEIPVVVHGANQSPSPAMVILFLSHTGIPYEVVHYEQLAVLPDFGARPNRTSPLYRELNPTRSIPTVLLGEERLVECSSILRRLSMQFHGLDSELYPATDLQASTQLNSYLDWHLTALRPAWQHLFAARMAGDAEAARTAFWGSNEGIDRNRPNGLAVTLEFFDRLWVRGGPFLCGRPRPSIADYAALCELALIQVLGGELGAASRDWQARMVAHLGDDPAWDQYGNRVMGEALAGAFPPAPADKGGYPFDWLDPAPDAL